MSVEVPSTDEVRERFSDMRMAAFVPEYRVAFDRWLAEVRRQAAEEAWARCVSEMPIDPDWKNFYGDNNPYREKGQ